MWPGSINSISGIENAKKINGPKFIQILSPCPTGWYYPPEKSVEISRLAVQSGIFPLFEYSNSIMKVTKPSKPVSIREYLSMQKRFAHLNNNDIESIQKGVDERMDFLLSKEREGKTLNKISQ